MAVKTLIMATNNEHKLREIRQILGDRFQVMGLADIGCNTDIPETSDTLEGNALQKARYVADNFGVDCFADDTGLEVEALHGAPGVYSARYAGEHCSFDDNIDKLLQALDGQTNRRAAFRTVICLIEHGEPRYFEGRVDGQILTERHSGGEGFGYDPVFMPDRFALSFAEMPLEVKNSISHRGLAVKKLVEYLIKGRRKKEE